MNWLRRYPLVFFFALAYLFAWLEVLIPHPVFAILAVAGPTIAAVIIVAALATGENLLARLFRWQAGAFWYAVAILGEPLLALGAVLILALLGQLPTNFAAALPLGAVPAIFIGRLLTNVWEEIGWRGFALPRLQARTNALVASLILGLLWGLWHLPIYVVGDTAQVELPFLLLLADTILISVVYTWLYNNTEGSLLFVTLFHVIGNTATQVAVGAGAPLVAYFTVRVLLILVADIVLVALTGAENLSRTKPRHLTHDTVEQPVPF